MRHLSRHAEGLIVLMLPFTSVIEVTRCIHEYEHVFSGK